MIYQIKEINQLNEELIDNWNILWRNSQKQNIFNSYQWFKTCLDFSRNKNYIIYLIYRNNDIVGILPLIKSKNFGIESLTTIGNKHLVYTGILLLNYEDEIIKFTFQNIIKKNNLFLNKLDSELAHKIKRLFPESFIHIMSINPYLKINPDPLRYIKKENFQNINRRIKKYPFPPELIILNSKKEMEIYIEKIFKIEQNSSKKTKNMDIFKDNKNKIFYRNLIKNCPEFINIAILKTGTEIISYSINFLNKQNFICYQTAFLAKYAKFAPGKIMTLKLLSTLKKDNIRSIDFGGGLNFFKLEFTPNYFLLYNCYLTNHILFIYWWRFINKLRRYKQILFTKEFTRDHELLFKEL